MSTLEDEIFNTGQDTDEILGMIHRAEGTRGDYSAPGASGESGKYQFMPKTWSSWASKHLGNPDAVQTPENQEKVARSQVEEWQKQGYGAKEILSLWNSGRPEGTAKGVNKYGVAYDTAAYINRGTGGGGQTSVSAGVKRAKTPSLEDQIYGVAASGEEEEEGSTAPAGGFKSVLEAIYAEPQVEEAAPAAPKRGLMEDIWSVGKAAGMGGARGVTTELPGVGGGMLEFIGEKLGIQPMADVGKEVKDWAEAKGNEWFGEIPESGLERIVYLGSSMLAPSIIPTGAAVTGVRALFGIGKLVKGAKLAAEASKTLTGVEQATKVAEATALMAQAGKLANRATNIGSAAGAGLFGASQAQNTVDNAMKQAAALEAQGKPVEAAAMRAKASGWAPLATGVIEAVGEFAGTKYLAMMFGLSEAQVLRYGEKKLVSIFLKTLGVEVGTEVGQQAGEAAVEKYTGIRPDANILAEALDVIGPTVFMTLITGGAGLGASRLAGKPVETPKGKEDKEDLRAKLQENLDAEQEKAAIPEAPPWTEPEAIAWTKTKEKEWKGYGVGIERGAIDDSGALGVTVTKSREFTDDEWSQIEEDMSGFTPIGEAGKLWQGSDEKGRAVRISLVDAFEAKKPEEAKETKAAQILAGIVEKTEEEKAAEAGVVAAPVATPTPVAPVATPAPVAEAPVAEPQPAGEEPAVATAPVAPAPAATEKEEVDWHSEVKPTVQEKPGVWTEDPTTAKIVFSAEKELIARGRVTQDRIRALRITAMDKVEAAIGTGPEARYRFSEFYARVLQDYLKRGPVAAPAAVTPAPAAVAPAAGAEITDETMSPASAETRMPPALEAIYNQLDDCIDRLKAAGVKFSDMEEDAEFRDLQTRVARQLVKVEAYTAPGKIQGRQEGREEEITKADADIDAAIKAKDEAALAKAMSARFPEALYGMDAAEMADLAKAKLNPEYMARLVAEAEKAEADKAAAKAAVVKVKAQVSVSTKAKAIKEQQRAAEKTLARLGAGRPEDREYEAFGGIKGYRRWGKMQEILGAKAANAMIPKIRDEELEARAAAAKARALVPKKEVPTKPPAQKSPVQMMKALNKLWKDGATKEAIAGTEEYAALAAGGADMGKFLEGLKAPVAVKGRGRKKKEAKPEETISQDVTTQEKPRTYTSEELSARAKAIQRAAGVDIGTAFRRAQYQLANGLAMETAAAAPAAAPAPVSTPKAEPGLEEPLRGRNILSGKEADILESEGRLQLEMDRIEKKNLFGKVTVHHESLGLKWGKDPSIYLVHEGGPNIGRFVRVLPAGSEAARQARVARDKEALSRKMAPVRKEAEEAVGTRKPLPGWAAPGYTPETVDQIKARTGWTPEEGRPGPAEVLGPGPHTMTDVLREVPEAPAESVLTPVPKGVKVTQLPPGGYVPLSKAQQDAQSWEEARALVIDHLGLEKDHTVENVGELLKEVNDALPPIQIALEEDTIGARELAPDVKRTYIKNKGNLLQAKKYLENRLDELKGNKPRHPVSVRRALRPDLENVPMFQTMPVGAVRPELRDKYPRRTSTVDMMNNGDRTATTRQPFAKVDQTITFTGVKGVWRVVEVIEPELTTVTGRREWEELEGWDLGYVDKNPTLRAQVYSDTAVQTILEKVGGAYEGLATEKQAEGEAKAGEGQLRAGPAAGAGEGRTQQDTATVQRGGTQANQPSVKPSWQAQYQGKFKSDAYARSPGGERGGAHFPGRDSFDSDQRPVVDSVMRKVPAGVKAYQAAVDAPMVCGNSWFKEGLSPQSVETIDSAGAATVDTLGVVVPEHRIGDLTEYRVTHEYTHIAYNSGHITDETVASVNRQATAYGTRVMATVDEIIKKNDKKDPLLEAALWLKGRAEEILSGEGFDVRRESVVKSSHRGYAAADTSKAAERRALEFQHDRLFFPDKEGLGPRVVELFPRSGIVLDTSDSDSSWKTAMSYIHVYLARKSNILLREVEVANCSLQEEMLAYHMGNHLQQSDVLFNQMATAYIDETGEGVTASPEEALATILKSDEATRGPPNTTQPGTSPNTPMRIRAMAMPELVRFTKEMMGGKLNVRMWPGLTAAKGATGRFNTKTGQMTLATELFENIKQAAATMGHEIGHVVNWMDEHLVGLTSGNILGRIANLHRFMKESYQTLAKNKEIREELKTLSQTMKPFDATADLAYTRYRNSSAELYADAISALVNDPDMLKKIAPKFTAGFFDYLYRKPKVQHIYDMIQADLQDEARLNLGRLELAGKGFEKAEQALDRELEEDKITQKSWWSNRLRQLSALTIDQNQRSLEADKRMKKMGVKVDPNMDLRLLLSEENYVDNLVIRFNKKMDDEVGKKIVELDIDRKDWSVYLAHLRVAEYQLRHIPFPGGYTTDTSGELLAAMKKKYGAEKFHEMGVLQKRMIELWNEHILNAAEKAELFSEEGLKEFRDNKFYSTFFYEHYMDDLFDAQGVFREMSAMVYEPSGHLDDDMLDPYTATKLKGQALLRAAHRAVTVKAIVAVNRTILGEDEVKDATRGQGGRLNNAPKGYETIVRMYKGKIKGYYVRPAVAMSFKSNPYEAHLIAKTIMGFSNVVKQIFVGKNPIWMSRNVPRDVIDSYKKQRGITLPSLIKEVLGSSRHIAWDYIFKDLWNSDVDEMHAGMMLVSGRSYGAEKIRDKGASGYDGGVSQIEKTLYAYAKDGKQANAERIGFFRAWNERLDKFGHFTEALTKIASYRLSKQYIQKLMAEQDKLTATQGRSARQDKRLKWVTEELEFVSAPKRQAYDIRNLAGTPDPYRRGRLSWLYNSIWMFSNIGKEGWRAHIETLTREGRIHPGEWIPSEYLWKTMKVTIIPKMLILAATFGWLGDWWKKYFDNISEYNKSVYNIVPFGKTNSGESIFLRIAPDYGGQVIGSLFYKFTNLIYEGLHSGKYRYNPSEWSNMFDFLLDTTPYGSVHPVLGLIMDAVALTRGMNPYDGFTGKTIVPDFISKIGDKWLTATAFLQYAGNKMTAGMLGRSPLGLPVFKSETVPYIKQEFYEKFANNTPILGPMAWTYVQVSDYGKRQRYAWVADAVQRETAKRSYDRRQAIWDSIKPYADEGKRPPPTAAQKLYRELIRDEVVDRKQTSWHNFYRMYERYALRTENSREIDMIIFSSTTAEKARLLDEYQKTMEPSAYGRVVMQLRREGMLTSETMAALRKLQTQNAKRR